MAETCDGSKAGCPTDSLSPAGTVCRAAAGDCDRAENCSGSSASCPSDLEAPDATACASDSDPCTLDAC
ncbi:MAG: hypothetical protein ACKOCT_09090, partial [Alphaproteobacteria bacterium]